MIKERRTTQRYAVGGVAKIQARANTLPRDCLVTDLSDGGVRLHAEGVEVPDQFVLMFGRDGSVRRDCRVMWRLGHEIGAEFIDGQQAGFARRMAG
jgi:hypothetical protein